MLGEQLLHCGSLGVDWTNRALPLPFRHGMLMLQKLSETHAAASPLQAQIHKIAQRVEALTAKTFDVLSSSVREEVSHSMDMKRSGIAPTHCTYCIASYCTGGWSDVYLTVLPCQRSPATSNSVQSDSMLVIELAKEKEPGATGGSSSASDQGTEKPHPCSGVATPICLQYNVCTVCG